MPFPFFLLGDTDLSRRGSPLLGAGGGGGVLLGPTLGSATLWTVGPGSPQEEPLETALGAVAFRPLVPRVRPLFTVEAGCLFLPSSFRRWLTCRKWASSSRLCRGRLLGAIAFCSGLLGRTAGGLGAHSHCRPLLGWAYRSFRRRGRANGLKFTSST